MQSCMIKTIMKTFIILVCLFFINGSVKSAEYFIATDGNDSNDGSEQLPWKSLGYGFAQIIDGDTLTVREGIYRLVEETNLSVINKPNITFQGYPGETVQLFGSATTEGKVWQPYNANVWRIAADFFNNDPKGMFNNHVRVEHQSDLDGGRDHDFVYNLVNPNMWTKADINGDQCFSSNTGCYIYLYPAVGEDPNTQVYELSQRSMARVAGNGDYMLVKNIEFYYTQSTAIFFEGADFITLDGNVFGNTSNGNDNSYAIRIWDSEGSVVKNNRVFDSKYWGGYSNSKGITFMVTKQGEPNVVEYNEIYDIPGFDAIGVKSGVSNLIVRYNYIHDVYSAFTPGGSRCVWSATNTDGCQSTDIEYRPGGNWKIYGNIVVNATNGVNLPGYINDGDDNQIYNNVFYQVQSGIKLGWDGTFGNVIANNIFISNESGIYLQSGGTVTTVPDYLDQYTSNNNLFFNNSNADIHLRPSWSGGYTFGTPYSLSQFQGLFNREVDSLSSDPVFVNTSSFELSENSPALDAGDGSFWGSPSVDIGAYPYSDFSNIIFVSGFE